MNFKFIILIILLTICITKINCEEISDEFSWRNEDAVREFVEKSKYFHKPLNKFIAPRVDLAVDHWKIITDKITSKTEDTENILQEILAKISMNLQDKIKDAAVTSITHILFEINKANVNIVAQYLDTKERGIPEAITAFNEMELLKQALYETLLLTFECKEKVSDQYDTWKLYIQSCFSDAIVTGQRIGTEFSWKMNYIETKFLKTFDMDYLGNLSEEDILHKIEVTKHNTLNEIQTFVPLAVDAIDNVIWVVEGCYVEALQAAEIDADDFRNSNSECFVV